MVCLDGSSIVHFYRIVNIWYYFRHFSQSGAVKNSKMLCLHRDKWPRARSCFYCLFKLRFQRLVDGADGGGIGFDGRTVIGEQAVHLVLHIGQLGVHQRRQALFQLRENRPERKISR